MHEDPMHLIHVRVPKTAGTTLVEQVWPLMFTASERFHFEGRYSDKIAMKNSLDRIRSCELRNLRFIYGNGVYDLPIDLPYPVRYMAFFRDPYERALSLYYHYKYRRHPTPSREQEGILTESWDLPTFLEYLMQDNRGSQIARFVSYADAARLSPAAQLERGLKNIEKLNHIFLKEYFDDAIDYLSLTYRRARPEYERRNVGHTERQTAALTQRDRRAVERYFGPEIELYRKLEERHDRDVLAVLRKD